MTVSTSQWLNNKLKLAAGGAPIHQVSKQVGSPAMAQVHDAPGASPEPKDSPKNAERRANDSAPAVTVPAQVKSEAKHEPLIAAEIFGELAADDDSSEAGAPSRMRSPGKSAATQLVDITNEYELFHDRQGRAFARVVTNGHTEVLPIFGQQFRILLAQEFYKRTKGVCNRNALGDAVTTIQGRAVFDGLELPVFMRVAPHGDNIIIDICDPAWRVIEVTPHGWQILGESPVDFIRTGSMRPLPIPSAGGSIAPLWNLLNVHEEKRPLIAGALLNYLHPGGPYFILDFVGEQGTAKSCAAKIVRMLIDPNETPLRSLPRTEQDLLVQAGNNRCIALDNLSSLQPWLSDALCRMATGGGHSARSLYTDGEEFTLSVKRPVILNGIDDVASRPDLKSSGRCVTFASPNSRILSCAPFVMNRFSGLRSR